MSDNSKISQQNNKKKLKYPNKPIYVKDIDSYSVVLIGGSSDNLEYSTSQFMQSGCHCKYFTYSNDAIKYLLERPVDLVILSSGFTNSLHKIRKFSSVPVLSILSNNALDIGGCDIVLRTNKDNYGVEACMKILFLLQQMRNSFEFTGSTLCQNVYINLDSFVATVDDVPLSLKPMEIKILFYLIKNKNRVINRKVFAKVLWDYEAIANSRTIDVHLKDLRSKLKESNANFKLLSLRNIGLQLLENDIHDKIDF